MIEPKLKRALGQMVKGVQVVGAAHDGMVRAYTSHWVSQVAFEEPVVMASVSPKHDTYPLLEASGVFSVSILAGDQVDAGQYFSYPGRRFRSISRAYYRGAHGMLVVYDITSRQSWENVKRWVEDVRRTLPEHDPMIPFIVGTCALAPLPRRLHSHVATESLTPVRSPRCSRGKERLDLAAEAGVC